MQYKYEVFDIFLKFKLYIENLFSSKIKMFQSDGGSEYTNKKFQNYLAHNGIGFRSFYPGHPEQNRVAERKYRHIIDTRLTLLAHTYDIKLFGRCISNCIILNKSSTNSCFIVPQSI